MSAPPRERLMPREADTGARAGSSDADAMLFEGLVAANMPAPYYLKVTLPQMF